MTLLILGIILWAGVHFWKRVSPGTRLKFGDAGKGIVAVGSVLAIYLMVKGYRAWDGTVYWGRTPATTGINNILMLLSVYLFAASGAKTRVAQAVRHPQLWALIVWAVAHVLVNGDTPSFVLFGGMALWALTEIVVLTRRDAGAVYAQAVPQSKEVSTVVISGVMLVLISVVHIWLGYNPFG